jgi:hypothetical protein
LILTIELSGAVEILPFCATEWREAFDACLAGVGGHVNHRCTTVAYDL